MWARGTFIEVIDEPDKVKHVLRGEAVAMRNDQYRDSNATRLSKWINSKYLATWLFMQILLLELKQCGPKVKNSCVHVHQECCKIQDHQRALI